MSSVDVAEVEREEPAQQALPRLGAPALLGAGTLLLALVAALVALSAWHLTQGTSRIGVGDLLRLVTDPDDPDNDSVRRILLDSRLPRLSAGLAVGFSLGIAGALLASVARNALASPDTLAVTAGAYFAVAAAAAFGLSIPLWASGATAFVGGICAAGLVLALSGGAGTSTTRLILAGSAIALALTSGTSALLILFDEETTGLFAWGSGSLTQLGMDAFLQVVPVIVVVTVVSLLIAGRLDLLALGDDTAAVLGLPVRRTRAIATVASVLLTAASVTLAGPIAFVGLCAPAIARMLAGVFPALRRHAVLLPAAGLVGAIIVVLADALMRQVLGPDRAISIPTGITTTFLGAVVMILIARQMRDAGPTRAPRGAAIGAHGTRRFVIVLTVGLAATAATGVVGLLGGYTWVRLGDVSLWLSGDAPAIIGFALDERAPRIAAALVAGAGLALAGSMVQATCRNPLAEPGILGITGGAGVGAVVAVTIGDSTRTQIASFGVIGGLCAFAVVYLLSWRKGLNSDRLVLIGIGMWYLTAGLSTFLLLRANPFDTPRIYTWLSGTTYGRTWGDVVPVVVALAAVLLVAFLVRRELDLLAVDDDTPRLAGVRLEPVRLLVLVAAAVLTALSVSAVGVVGFVGLVAPHAARALVGGRHSRSLWISMAIGAVMLGAADTIGRTVIAPAQVPAGILVALIGAPYFIYLLARTRA